MNKGSNEDLDLKVGDLIRKYRVSQGLSQASLGQALGVTFQQIQKYEKGKNRISAGKLLKALVVLQIPLLAFEDLNAPAAHDIQKQSLLDIHIVEKFSKLNPEMKKAVLNLIKTMSASDVDV